MSEPLDLGALERLAKNAKTGQWRLSKAEEIWTLTNVRHGAQLDYLLAVSHPERILALIERIRELEEGRG